MAYGYTYTLPTITGSHSDYPVLLREGDFPSSAIDGTANAIDNGGGNLRAYTSDAKTTQLPVEVVTFVSSGSQAAQVWVKIPTAATSNTIFIEADAVETTQPAVTGAYGRNAVWSDYEYVGHLNDTPTDSTGNNTPSESGTFGTRSSGFGSDDVYDFDGSTNNIDLGAAVGDITTGDISLQIWANLDVETPFATLISRRTGGDYNWHWRTELRDPAILIGGASPNDPGSVLSTATWYKLDLTITSNTAEYYQNGSSGGTQSTNNGVTRTVNTSIGANDDLSLPFNGGLQEARIRLDAVSTNWIATEYDNQNASSNWGTVGAWADAGGSGRIMGSLAGIGGLAGSGGLAGKGGGLAG